MQILSFVNIILAVIYILAYLNPGVFNSTAGIVMIITFNWLGLRSFQLDNYRWSVWHYLTGLWSLYFIGTLVYGVVNIISASIEFNFISNDTLLYLIVSFCFYASMMGQFFIYAYRNCKALKLN